MLVDFLKGNHFEVPTATVGWLWKAKGSACYHMGESLKGIGLKVAWCLTLIHNVEVLSFSHDGERDPGLDN
jgi:hypothetical protein